MPSLFARAVLVGTVTLGLAAFGASPESRTASVLDQRLHEQLGNDIAANRVAVHRLPDGARVTFLDRAPSPGGLPVSDPNEGSSRAGLVEALLDPALMRVVMADTSNMPEERKDERVDDLTAYFQSLQLGSIIHPEDTPATQAPEASGLAVTIRVVCPHRHGRTGYDSGERKPDCF